MGKVYAVRVGRRPGIYESWDEVKPLVSGYPGAQHKSFAGRAAAEAYLREGPSSKPPHAGAKRSRGADEDGDDGSHWRGGGSDGQGEDEQPQRRSNPYAAPSGNPYDAPAGNPYEARASNPYDGGANPYDGGGRVNPYVAFSAGGVGGLRGASARPGDLPTSRPGYVPPSYGGSDGSGASARAGDPPASRPGYVPPSYGGGGGSGASARAGDPPASRPGYVPPSYGGGGDGGASARPGGPPASRPGDVPPNYGGGGGSGGGGSGGGGSGGGSGSGGGGSGGSGGGGSVLDALAAGQAGVGIRSAISIKHNTAADKLSNDAIDLAYR
ncbi:hypothetical protein TSOC_010937 [Tetrabaena socialis]|uniref:Ribonuclease H n=1 Tax=Tetrabaena socialis TaxID=47790 RepID=A0A2J7ZS03_9CHLO|nr:hypothetical protein TSOC_010937 [Tetrabaena socialis]|eukprot:PNH03045.1 hypothetical protein TSOC_010937 [Tetrabaena socialis]